MTDGKHLARLFDLSFFSTSGGAKAVSFVWEAGDERVSYALAVTDANGRPNYFGIQVTQRWVPQWDGREIEWFDDHREEVIGTSVELTIERGAIIWVSSAEAQTPVATPAPQADAQPQMPQETVGIHLIVDAEKLAQAPDEIEPTFEEAKALFDLITEGTEKLDADKVWTLLAKKIGPMQIDFGRDEWQQMIDRIRRLKSWSGRIER